MPPVPGPAAPSAPSMLDGGTPRTRDGAGSTRATHRHGHTAVRALLALVLGLAGALFDLAATVRL